MPGFWADAEAARVSVQQIKILRNWLTPYDTLVHRLEGALEMAELLEAAARVLPPEQLWVNPDCGLKTRGWPETEAALHNLVRAARQLREELVPATE